MLSKADLFSRLAEGHAARITVVTPNRRLSQALVADFDSFQAKNNKTVWEAADILPFDAFVQRLYEDALYSDLGVELPMLLTPAQEEQLWRQAVEKAALLAPDEAAARCADAWRLMHAWRIRPGAGNDDSAAFQQWASVYQKKTPAQTDAARLPDLLNELLKEKNLKKPKLLVAYAFDILPTQTREFFAALSSQGVEVLECHPEKREGTVARTSFQLSKDELDAAARWARAKLEQGASRIGVVVPDLQQRRREVVRVFSRVMQPGYNLPGAAKVPMPFNISLGVALDQYPVVALALSLLQFSKEDIPFAEVSELIRSPFIAGAEKELAARAKLDAKLRRTLGATVSLPKLISLLEKKTVLREKLEKVFALRDDGLFSQKTPSEWARHFSTLLDAAGFPGERGLDSDEYQAQAKWHEMLGELAKLDRVLSNIAFLQALSALKRLCGETLFQPETADAPIQVLGILESAGMEFDHLWVSGLTDEAWPLRARPNPFLPVAQQVKAGIAEASAEGSLALDRRLTEGWLAAADEVVFSCYEKDQDREVAPSPLILGVPRKDPEVPAFPSLRNLIFKQRKLQSVSDTQAPPLKAATVRGGTRVLADQSACPFRAFAHHRLRAEELETPAEGLDPSDRGKLLHALMASLFAQVKSSADLALDLDFAIELAAAFAVKELKLEGRFAELERTRLARLAREWLEVERGRKDFEVVAVEKPIAFKVAGLELSGRIDRIDRIAGGLAIIDYKTSRNPSPNQWKPPRPEDPQLPIYAVASQEPVAAVAFAKVRPGEMRYMGFSREKDSLPRVRKAEAWQPLLQSWSEEAEALGTAFAAGAARVDPKNELQTCRYCDLQTLCRVYEKVNPLKEDEAEGFGE